MKKILLISAVVLLILVILVMVAGPFLKALGVDVLCITEENGRNRLVRCGGESVLSADTSPPELAAGANRC